MPIVFRTAIKPTPSIFKEQNSVSLENNTEEKLQIKGRHDPCIVQRAVPVVEAVTAITLLDIML
jgi:chorismate synthase